MGRHAGVDYRLRVRSRRAHEEIAEALDQRLRNGEIRDERARRDAIRIIRDAVRLLLARKRLPDEERTRLLERFGEYVA